MDLKREAKRLCMIILAIDVISILSQDCPDVCKADHCFCESHSIPGDLKQKDTPQLLIFTYEGPVTQILNRQIHHLFGQQNTNPNGCPASMTLFVSDNKTDYTIVNRLAVMGHEIASQGLNPGQFDPTGTAQQWADEMVVERRRIALQANVSEEQIVGMRAANLQAGGDAMFRMIDKYRFKYDSSLIFSIVNGTIRWPFNLKQPLPKCSHITCPKLPWDTWEIPVQPWRDVNGKTCTYIDQCLSPFETNKANMSEYLWKQFNDVYNDNRAPLLVNLRPQSLLSDQHVSVLAEFVKKSLQRRGVWILNIDALITWMKTPTPISKLKDFIAWKCETKKKKPPIEEEQNYIMQFLGIGATGLVILQYSILALALLILVLNERQEKKREEQEHELEKSLMAQ